MSRAKQQNLFSTIDEHRAPWELAAEQDRLVAQVVLNRPVDTAYSYLVPDELRSELALGQRVRVPFGKGNRLTVGYVVDLGPAGDLNRALKAVHSVVDAESLLSAKMLELTRWIAGYYLCGWGQVLDAVVPAGVKKQSGTRMATVLTVAAETCARLDELQLPSKQRAVLETLCSAQQPLRPDEVARAAGCGTGPVQALRKKGFIQAERQRREQFIDRAQDVQRSGDLTLNRDQQSALDAILALLRSGRHRTVLLHGITGSGKTELYIQAIREVIGYGRQAIVLVPEISLTPQTIRRFRSRFDSVAVLHSHLSDAERHGQWRRIRRGEVQVVVGARSAIFAPVPHLGLIVIDEEHETSFKQETTPRYHAREVARKRAELETVPLILGSATPTLESWHRVQQGRDMLLALPRRIDDLPLPPVVVVDTRNDPHIRKGAALGRVLESAMHRTLQDGGQVILFLNLRGFSPALWCRACGESARCPHCDITLTWHKDRNLALCHICDYQTLPPRECPQCRQPGVLFLGIGTQRLEEEVRAKFPNQKVLRMDSDSMRRPGSHDAALESFQHGTTHILLGTQMIAKGLDFPNVTLVGVIDADTILHQPDFRAAERTFGLLAQVAGRTGRGRQGGRVLVQTASPTEPAIVKAAEHDYAGFVEQELAHRREMAAPPYRHLARVILRGPKEDKVADRAHHLAEVLRQTAEQTALEVHILGPAPAPVAKLKKNYRYHFHLTAPELNAVHQLWQQACQDLPRADEVESTIDVDPINMR